MTHDRLSSTACSTRTASLPRKDVVNTALMDAKRSNSAVLHTPVGHKYGEEEN